jgi:hypothetical protein
VGPAAPGHRAGGAGGDDREVDGGAGNRGLPAVLLDVGFSARSAADLKALTARLDELPRVVIDREVERLVSSLMFESQWLAPAGTL